MAKAKKKKSLKLLKMYRDRMRDNLPKLEALIKRREGKG